MRGDLAQGGVGFRAKPRHDRVEQEVRADAHSFLALTAGGGGYLPVRRRTSAGQLAGLALGSAVPPISTQNAPVSSPSILSRILEESIDVLFVPKPARTNP
jgi:hypothetical protein